MFFGHIGIVAGVRFGTRMTAKAGRVLPRIGRSLKRPVLTQGVVVQVPAVPRGVDRGPGQGRARGVPCRVARVKSVARARRACLRTSSAVPSMNTQLATHPGAVPAPEGTRYRVLYAISGNAEVARLAGINVQRATVLVYVVCSFLAGLSGMVLAARLDPRHFARVHRSAIVNIRRVKAIHPWFNGHHVVTLDTGQQLRMSRYQHEAFLRLTGR